MYFLDGCPIPSQIVGVVKNFYNVLLIAVPILLLVLGTVDLVKAVMAGDEKDTKAATSLLGKRMFAAVAVFLLGSIISFVLSLVPDSSGWLSCWGASSGGNNNTGNNNGGNNTSLTISCPSKFVYDPDMVKEGSINYTVGTITTDTKFTKYDVSEGFRLIKDSDTKGYIVTTKDFNWNILQVRITVENDNGGSSQCTVAVESNVG